MRGNPRRPTRRQIILERNHRANLAGINLYLLVCGGIGAGGAGRLTSLATPTRLTSYGRGSPLLNRLLGRPTTTRPATTFRAPPPRTGRACSFSADTKVLLADGSTTPISDIETGDWVYATDPVTGEHGAREVTATWVHDDTLLDLQLAGGASVTTTANHRFWNHTDQRWEPADTLDPGVHLLTPDGDTITVVGLDPTTAHTAPAHNLTINDLHTYYVLAGDTPVLVHNAAHNRPRPGCGYTSQGVKRHNPADWRRTRDLWDELGYGDILSPANRQRIAAGRTPIVDDHWIRYFPGDALLRGQRITMHHIGGGPITVPLPTSRHLTAHMPGGFRYNPGGPGSSG